MLYASRFPEPSHSQRPQQTEIQVDVYIGGEVVQSRELQVDSLKRELSRVKERCPDLYIRFIKDKPHGCVERDPAVSYKTPNSRPSLPTAVNDKPLGNDKPVLTKPDPFASYTTPPPTGPTERSKKQTTKRKKVKFTDEDEEVQADSAVAPKPRANRRRSRMEVPRLMESVSAVPPNPSGTRRTSARSEAARHVRMGVLGQRGRSSRSRSRRRSIGSRTGMKWVKRTRARASLTKSWTGHSCGQEAGW